MRFTELTRAIYFPTRPDFLAPKTVKTQRRSVKHSGVFWKFRLFVTPSVTQPLLLTSTALCKSFLFGEGYVWAQTRTPVTCGCDHNSPTTPGCQLITLGSIFLLGRLSNNNNFVFFSTTLPTEKRFSKAFIVSQCFIGCLAVSTTADKLLTELTHPCEIQRSFSSSDSHIKCKKHFGYS